MARSSFDIRAVPITKVISSHTYFKNKRIGVGRRRVIGSILIFDDVLDVFANFGSLNQCTKFCFLLQSMIVLAVDPSPVVVIMEAPATVLAV